MNIISMSRGKRDTESLPLSSKGDDRAAIDGTKKCGAVTDPTLKRELPSHPDLSDGALRYELPLSMPSYQLSKFTGPLPTF